MNEGFWTAIDKLVSESEIVIDRSVGSAHPRYPHIIYQVAYGYLKDTQAMDGGGIDVWVGSGEKTVVGIICTVDLLKRDSEIKILIGCNEKEIDYIYNFHNDSQYMKGILIRR
ncbi:MAG: inorganic pyrophosphatase [Clostridiales bacterium]|nr:inorganic pyrophosphatase [Clostridiales bacterium]